MIDDQDLKSCRDRNGEPHPHRPAWVDDVFSDASEVGYGKGASLGGDDDGYEHYPSGDGDDISDPRYGRLVEEVLNHPLVNDIDDAVAELKYTNAEQLEKIARFHGLDVDTLLDNSRVGYTPEDVAEKSPECPEGAIQIGENSFRDLDYYRELPWEDSRLLGHCLGTLGMSARETAHWISIHSEYDPDEQDIREAAKTCGVLSGNANVEYLTQKAEERRRARMAQQRQNSF